MSGALRERGKVLMKKTSKKNLITIIIACVIAVIFLPLLAINLTLIIKGSVNKDVPPDIFGIAPLAVTTGSMDGGREDGFAAGSLIFVRILSDEQKNELEAGDIVTFRAEENIFVTHRIVAVNRGENNEVLSLVTQGDANNAADGEIAISQVIGICTGSAAGLGDFALFLQTPAGIIVFVGMPVIAFIALDAARIFLFNRKARQEEQSDKALREKDEEIARLRAIIGESGEVSADGALNGGENSAEANDVGNASSDGTEDAVGQGEEDNNANSSDLKVGEI